MVAIVLRTATTPSADGAPTDDVAEEFEARPPPPRNPLPASGHEADRMDVDDGTLWRRARAGDADAFGILFERHATAIYNYCLRRTGDWSVAEDLLSIVFLEAWRHRDRELPGDKILPWLYGVATNVVRNRHRSQRRYAAALRRIPRPQSSPDFSEASESRIDAERQIRPLLDALSQLPKREREVFILCGWSELSYEDAAFALDVPVGTVRSRLSRARGRLRELAPQERTQDGWESQRRQERMNQ